MGLSEKEKTLLDFITSNKQVSVVQIQKDLGEKAIGGLGRLINQDLIEKKKIRETNDYGTKSVVYYMLKEDTNG